jgi:hypothetical protein
VVQAEEASQCHQDGLDTWKIARYLKVGREKVHVSQKLIDDLRRKALRAVGGNLAVSLATSVRSYPVYSDSRKIANS